MRFAKYALITGLRAALCFACLAIGSECFYAVGTGMSDDVTEIWSGLLFALQMSYVTSYLTMCVLFVMAGAVALYCFNHDVRLKHVLWLVPSTAVLFHQVLVLVH